MGMFLGFSHKHSSLVQLVLNLHTGHVSPQYHVIFDDNFETVPSLNLNCSDIDDKFASRCSTLLLATSTLIKLMMTTALTFPHWMPLQRETLQFQREILLFQRETKNVSTTMIHYPCSANPTQPVTGLLPTLMLPS